MESNSLPRLVRELMTVGVLTCSPDTPIEHLVPLILEKNLEEIMVMEDGNAIGVVGQEEIVRVLADQDWKFLKAVDIMREEFLVIPPDIPITTAVEIMQDKKVRAAFLIHHAGGVIYPAGIITYRHVLRLLAAKHPKDLIDLGYKAARQLPLESFFQRREATRKKLLTK